MQLTALQEAHEREIAAYLSNITPLREQLEIQQVTITTLQTQLRETKEELAIITVEKEHLTNKLKCSSSIINLEHVLNGNGNEDVMSLRKKVLSSPKTLFIYLFILFTIYFLLIDNLFGSETRGTRAKIKGDRSRFGPKECYKQKLRTMRCETTTIDRIQS